MTTSNKFFPIHQEHLGLARIKFCYSIIFWFPVTQINLVRVSATQPYYNIFGLKAEASYET